MSFQDRLADAKQSVVDISAKIGVKEQQLKDATESNERGLVTYYVQVLDRLYVSLARYESTHANLLRIGPAQQQGGCCALTASLSLFYRAEHCRAHLSGSVLMYRCAAALQSRKRNSALRGVYQKRYPGLCHIDCRARAPQCRVFVMVGRF